MDVRSSRLESGNCETAGWTPEPEFEVRNQDYKAGGPDRRRGEGRWEWESNKKKARSKLATFGEPNPRDAAPTIISSGQGLIG